MNKDEMRKMWEQAAGYMPQEPRKPIDTGMGGPRPPNPRFPDGVIIDGPQKPPRTTDEFGRPKPWTPGDEDRRKPGDKNGDKYGGYGGKGPSPRPSKKPNTRPDTPPSMMHDKEDIKGYPSVKPPIKPPINKIDKTQSIKHDSLKDYKQPPKP